MSDIASYQDLKVWQQAMDLSVAVYEASRDWPPEERYGLTSQARRSAVSVAANIAEGYGRENRGSYVHFLKMAQGSLKELETHVLLAQRLGFLALQRSAPLLAQSQSVGKLLRALFRSLAADE